MLPVTIRLRTPARGHSFAHRQCIPLETGMLVLMHIHGLGSAGSEDDKTDDELSSLHPSELDMNDSAAAGSSAGQHSDRPDPGELAQRYWALPGKPYGLLYQSLKRNAAFEIPNPDTPNPEPNVVASWNRACQGSGMRYQCLLGT
jgi:hypothetical protein